MAAKSLWWQSPEAFQMVAMVNLYAEFHKALNSPQRSGRQMRMLFC
jgi:hypothetical protein